MVINLESRLHPGLRVPLKAPLKEPLKVPLQGALEGPRALRHFFQGSFHGSAILSGIRLNYWL